MRKAAVAAVFLLTCECAAEASDSPLVRALRFFEAFSGYDVEAILRTLRPPPASADQRAAALGVLPEAGELSPDQHERAKLAVLGPVLAYHERAGVFEIKVIDVPQAVVALHERTVLLISRPALQLVSGDELQALVAHEIGHEYFWADFERTIEQHDRRGRQELELKCDGIAVLTLVALGLDRSPLLSGLQKIWRLNETLGAIANADEYPKMSDRRQLVNAVRDAALAHRSRG